MKKVFKAIPVALGLLALASCSNDDDFASEKLVANNGTLTVTTETQFDVDAVTRSAVGYARVGSGSKNGTLWGTFFLPGDQIKVYGTESWKYQVWEKTSDGDTPVENAGSVVSSSFELKNVLKAAATEEDELFGFDKVGHAVYPAGLAVFANEERSGITVTNFISDNGTITLTEATDGDAEKYNYPIKASYTDLENKKLFSCNVPLWGKAKDGKCDMKNLAGLMKIAFQGKAITAGDQIVITATGTGEYLWGDADVTGFNYDGDDIPEITNKTLKEKKDDSNNVLNQKLTIKLPALTGDNYILVPIPAGKYSSLNVAYTNALGTTIDGNEKTYTNLEVGTGFFKVNDKAFWALTVTKEESISDANVYPSTIEKALTDTYANFGRNVVVDVENALQVGGTAEKDEYTTITLPELKNTVTLNLKNGIAQYKSGDETAKLVIKGGKGAGKLVINVPSDKASAAAIDASAVAVPVEINYANSTALDKDVTINDKVTLTGKYAAVEATEAVTFANAVEIITLKSEKNVTVVKGTITTVDAEKATVTVKGEAAVATVKAKKAIVDNVAVTTVEAAEAVTIDAKDKTVGTLTLKGAATVTLKNGTITTIDASAAAAAESTINSEGASLIGTVTGTVKNITSKWDGTSAMGTLKGNDNNNIYTAAHLAQTAKTAVYAQPVFNILADEIDLDNKDWTGIISDYNGSTYKLTVKGKEGGSVIKNVKIAGTGFIANAVTGKSRTLTVQDITLDGVKYEGAGNAIGALLGESKNGTTITNVVVKNASIAGAAASYNLGGLIGTVSGGTTTIKNSSVSVKTLKGYYNMGGLVGSISGATTKVAVTAESGKVVTIQSGAVSLAKEGFTNANDDNCGTIGVVVGSMQDAGATLEFVKGAKAKDFISGQANIYKNDALKFSNNWYRDAEDNKFVFVGPSSAYVGYSPAYTPAGGKANISRETKAENKTNVYVGTVQYYGFQINNFVQQ